MSEYKKYDSDDVYIQHNARLAFPPEVREVGEGRKLVKVKFTSEAKGQDREGNDRYETMWVEAIVNDFDSEKAEYLEKGDVLTIEGKPALRLWGDDNDKVSFELLRARLHIPVSLFMELKARGFEAGGKKGGKSKGKAAAKKTKGKRKPIVEIPDDDEDADEGEE